MIALVSCHSGNLDLKEVATPIRITTGSMPMGHLVLVLRLFDRHAARLLQHKRLRENFKGQVATHL